MYGGSLKSFQFGMLIVIFFVVHRPSGSTLFPYTTLFRSLALSGSAVSVARIAGEADFADRPIALRSEEHTSELQSLTNLVCRPLLEKKKTWPDRWISHQTRHSTADAYTA